VGQGRPKDKRIINNNDKFWFEPSIIESASNGRIDDQILRERFEVVLIKFLKRNAIVNKHIWSIVKNSSLLFRSLPSDSF
jgi:hypothetical protein